MIMGDWLKIEPPFQGLASGTRLGKVMRRLGFEPIRIGHERTVDGEMWPKLTRGRPREVPMQTSRSICIGG